MKNVVVFGIVFLLTACKANYVPARDMSSILTGNLYQLVSYQGQKVDNMLGVTLSVDSNNQLSARFCNSIRGKTTTNADSFKAMNVAMTRMACENKTLMEMENTFAQALNEGLNLQLKTNAASKQYDMVLKTKSNIDFVFEWKAQFTE